MLLHTTRIWPHLVLLLFSTPVGLMNLQLGAVQSGADESGRNKAYKLSLSTQSYVVLFCHLNGMPYTLLELLAVTQF